MFTHTELSSFEYIKVIDIYILSFNKFLCVEETFIEGASFELDKKGMCTNINCLTGR